MRTTLTLDEDVAAKLQELARRRRISFKEAVNSALRRGLSSQATGPEKMAPARVETFQSAFRPGVDLLRLNQLSEDLELERFRRGSPP
jgi:Arc/MetJ family transcription regulator